MNITWLRIPTGGRWTNWLVTNLCDQGVELGTTMNNTSCWSDWNLSLQPPDFNYGPLTSRSCCLLNCNFSKCWKSKIFVQLITSLRFLNFPLCYAWKDIVILVWCNFPISFWHWICGYNEGHLSQGSFIGIMWNLWHACYSFTGYFSFIYWEDWLHIQVWVENRSCLCNTKCWGWQLCCKGSQVFHDI